MTRLIDADALKKENERLLHCDFPYLSETTLEELIDEQPTIDAEPVRHGKWIESDEYDEYRGRLYRCSNCNTFVVSDMDNYCPYCGARMDEE